MDGLCSTHVPHMCTTHVLTTAAVTAADNYMLLPLLYSTAASLTISSRPVLASSLRAGSDEDAMDFGVLGAV